MATTNGTSVLFYKVTTMTQFNDLTKIDGAIYFVESEKKLYLDGIWYGFSDTDGGQFLKLIGGTMVGDIDMGEGDILNVNNIYILNSQNKISPQNAEGGMEFWAGTNGRLLLTLGGDNTVQFNADSVSGLPEPVVPSAPITKEYLETNVINKKGVANGFASLDTGGKVPSTQLPSYVDDVLEFANQGAFPQPGESGIIYVARDNNKTYRWSSSAYVEISPSLALGETSGSAYYGDRGKTAYDHSQMTYGNPHMVTKEHVSLGNVENYGIATKAEAQAGTSSAKYMTPERTKEAILALAPKLTWTVVS